MKIKFALMATLAVSLGVAALVQAPRLSAQRNETQPGAAQPGTRCTRLTLPTLKEYLEYQKLKLDPPVDPSVGTTSPGTRCTRLSDTRPPKGKGLKILANEPPSVGVFASLDDVTVNRVGETFCLTRDGGVKLAASARDPDADQMLYTWSVTGGRVAGDGADVVWDLKGVEAGTYTATVEVDDGCGCIAFASATLPVK